LQPEFKKALLFFYKDLKCPGGETCLPAGRLVDALCSGRSFKKELMFFVYAIRSLNRTYIYVGLTENVERRFLEHQSGKNKTTKPYRPFEIILVEEFPTRIEAREREKYLKSGIGKEFLKTIIKT
jgi:putative endonuclease